MKKGLSYDDVLLQPKKTSVTSLSDVSTSENVCGIEIPVPVFSAPMDTVTEKEFAVEIAELGGIGVIHRFMSAEEQASQVEEVKQHSGEAVDEDGRSLVGAAVGLKDNKRAEKLVEAGVDFLVLDIAHGHHESMIEKVENYSEQFSDTILVVGNVATPEGASDLEKAGADMIKVGIGPGSACTTREVTGAGVPQFTAVKECSEAVDVPVIADGGIRQPGDLAKALMAGASAGMIGGMFAGTDETPGELLEDNGDKFKVYRGMSTQEAAEKRAEREGRDLSYSDKVSEGLASRVKHKGALEEVTRQLRGGLRSSISYCGADNLQEARENAEFVKITSSSRYRSGSHLEGL